MGTARVGYTADIVRDFEVDLESFFGRVTLAEAEALWRLLGEVVVEAKVRLAEAGAADFDDLRAEVSISEERVRCYVEGSKPFEAEASTYSRYRHYSGGTGTSTATAGRYTFGPLSDAVAGIDDGPEAC